MNFSLQHDMFWIKRTIIKIPMRRDKQVNTVWLEAEIGATSWSLCMIIKLGILCLFCLTSLTCLEIIIYFILRYTLLDLGENSSNKAIERVAIMLFDLFFGISRTRKWYSENRVWFKILKKGFKFSHVELMTVKCMCVCVCVSILMYMYDLYAINVYMYIYYIRILYCYACLK